MTPDEPTLPGVDTDVPHPDTASQLSLITDMINKAKAGVNENGQAAIMWGAVVGIAGTWGFINIEFDLTPPFDPWLLCFLALIPQAWLVYTERKSKTFMRHGESIINAVWTVYGISIGLMVLYLNLVPGIAKAQLLEEGIVYLRSAPGKGLEPANLFVPSGVSLMMILYFIPTMVMGMGVGVKPMLAGALLNIIFFVISLFTVTKYDLLLAGATGIFNWLIPGIIMQRQYLMAKREVHV